MAEELDEANLDESFREHIFAPLGLAETPPTTPGRDRAFHSQEHSGERGWICGEVHDSKAYHHGGERKSGDSSPPWTTCCTL